MYEKAHNKYKMGLSDLHRQPHPFMLSYHNIAYFTSSNTIATIHENRNLDFGI